MIARYIHPEMAKIWEERNKYLIWLKIEMAVCEELRQLGIISKEDWLILQEKVDALMREGGVDPNRVQELEVTTRHDVIAFTTAITEKVGSVARYIHFGLTSSDIVDTGLALLTQEAGNILLKNIDVLLKVLIQQAEKYKEVPTIGRSHGIFAEPTSFGLKFLGWYCEWQRNRNRLEAALQSMAVGKLSGAVGVNPHWGPHFEEQALKKLGLRRELVSTQIVPRDRHAEFIGVLSILGSSLERISIELRHLQRSEVREVMEGFKKGQKGSSAMPHKRNPISSENISGCARLLRSYAQASLENIALWHERDISHSSVERVIFPDATLILDYALRRMNTILTDLIIQNEQVQKNLNDAGSTVFSGHFLLELVKEGVSREEAYEWIQQCALQSFEKKEDFIELLCNHAEIRKRLSEKKIRELGSIQYQLRNVDEIYRKVYLDHSSKMQKVDLKN